MKTRYARLLDLSELPYFDLRDGRLTVSSDLGPLIDVHTHLALSFGPKAGVDLTQSHDAVEHYLPVDTPTDLDIYANQNFTPEQRRKLGRDLTWASLTSSGMRRTHTAPNLLAEMDELSIATSILLPIDFPILSDNAERFISTAERYAGLESLGSVHPFSKDPAAFLEKQKAMGGRGVKIHPAVQLVAPDHAKAMALYPICARLGLPVLFHCGPVGIEPKIGRRLSQVKNYWRAIAENPETTFVLGHSGALQMEQALVLAKNYENVCLEMSSQSLGAVRTILEEAPQERIMFGSDWPFYHQALPLAKVLIALEGKPESLRKAVLWENATRVFGLA